MIPTERKNEASHIRETEFLDTVLSNLHYGNFSIHDLFKPLHHLGGVIHLGRPQLHD